MSHLRFCLVFVVCYLCFSGLQAQPAGEPTLEEVLQRYYAANGGLENLRSVISLTASGTVLEADGSKVAITLIKKRPNMRLLVRKNEDGSSYTQGYDGSQGWAQLTAADGSKRSRKLAVDAEMPFDPPLIDPEGNQARLDFAGTEREGRNFFYLIRATLPNGSYHTYWLDARTLRELRSEYRWKDDAGVEHTRIDHYVEAEKINDIWFARKTITEVDGVESVTTLDVILMNSGVFNDLFSLPDVLR